MSWTRLAGILGRQNSRIGEHSRSASCGCRRLISQPTVGNSLRQRGGPNSDGAFPPREDLSGMAWPPSRVKNTSRRPRKNRLGCRSLRGTPARAHRAARRCGSQEFQRSPLSGFAVEDAQIINLAAPEYYGLVSSEMSKPSPRPLCSRRAPRPASGSRA